MAAAIAIVLATCGAYLLARALGWRRAWAVLLAGGVGILTAIVTRPRGSHH